MTRESSLWNRFREALPACAHAVRVENGVEVGTPDVNLCLPGSAEVHDVFCSAGKGGFDGWIELKVQEPPKRKTTKFRCEHFTMEQKQWLVNRVRAGGKAYMLLQAGDEYLFLRGDVAAVWIGHHTLAELIEKAAWHGTRLEELVRWLRC